MSILDKILNNYTQYKVVLYGLLILCLSAIFFSVVGYLDFSPLSLTASFVALIVSAYISNFLFSKLFSIPVNSESYLITALILFLIVQPPTNLKDYLLLILLSAFAIVSKFVIKIKISHVFNPVAIAAFVFGLLGAPIVTWWVTNSAMIPISIFVGLLVLRKTRRFSMFTTFFIFSSLAIILFNYQYTTFMLTLGREIIIAWPIIFLGTIMLTEPRTAPGTHNLQLAFGAIVGFLFGSNFSVGPLYSTPELALLVGNILAFATSQKAIYKLKLEKTEKITSELYSFIFSLDKKINFDPGQYMEFTLEHDNVDLRGNRRYLSLASSPTENKIMLGVKIPRDSSSFKKALKNLKNGDTISAAHPSGDFTLPKNASEKLVFIAGGIGITPFRSMIKYLIDIKQNRSITLLYTAKNDSDFIYKEFFDYAKKHINLKIDYIPTSKEGYITPKVIKKVDDYKACKYYISGPNVMVNAYKKLLRDVGISSNKIKVDYFPGY